MRIFNFQSRATATVVIPIYKSSLSYYEEISLKQCCKVLGNHTITIIKPHCLNADGYAAYYTNFRIESFDDDYFKDTTGYNRLMLSPVFYERFLQYDFILIYQLDAFVFKNELNYWCRKGYDYVGAPWLTSPFEGSFLEKKKYLQELRRVYKNNVNQEGSNLPVDAQVANRVGNGGFSLRRVKKFYKISMREKQLITLYNEQSRHHFFNEDVFWSLEVNRKHKRLRIPEYKEAVYFSVEFKPEYAFKLTNGELPFGCHAWDLYIDFWKDKIKKFDFVI